METLKRKPLKALKAVFTSKQISVVVVLVPLACIIIFEVLACLAAPELHYIGLGFGIFFSAILILGFWHEILIGNYVFDANGKLISNFSARYQPPARDLTLSLEKLNSLVDEISMASVSVEDLRTKLGNKFRLQGHCKVYYSNTEIIGMCSVCKLAIYSSESVIECPTCHHKAHQLHLLEWIKIRGFCPNCEAHFNKYDLELCLLKT